MGVAQARARVPPEHSALDSFLLVTRYSSSGASYRSCMPVMGGEGSSVAEQTDAAPTSGDSLRDASAHPHCLRKKNCKTRVT